MKKQGLTRFYTVLIVLLIMSNISISKSVKTENGFYRFPDVHGDRVVFTSEGDLWSASLNSKSDAVRLTRHDGEESYARISPDGDWIAFTAEYDGNRDVFVIPASGGEAVRLTFHPAWDEVVGWTNDSRKVLFRSHRNSPFFTWRIFSVGLDGGFPEDYGLDKVTRLSPEPDGKRVAYTRLRRETSSWKRYKGGLAMDIWVGDLRKMEFRNITEYEGTDAFPMWVGDRIYYLSDQSGRANIFSMNPDGKAMIQHTFEEDWDVRWPSTDGENIVYQKAMDIWAYNVQTGKSKKIDINLPSDRIRARKRIVNPSGYIDSYSLPNEGRRFAVAARGEVFTFPVEKAGYIRQVTHSLDARDRAVAFSPDGKRLAIINDVTGEDEIWLHSSDGKEKPIQLTKKGDRQKYWLSWSPNGEMLVYSDKSNQLWVVDVKSGKQTLVDDAPDLWNYEWSPDSRWIAWIRFEEDQTSDIHLYNVETKNKDRIETPMIQETDLAWDPDGKYLYFTSPSWYNPVLGHGGAYIYDQPDKFYAILLSEETENPFAPKIVEAFEMDDDEDGDSDDDAEEEDEGEKDSEVSDDEEDVEPIEIQFEGLQARIIYLPIEAGNYFGLSAASGKIYFGSYERSGMMPEAHGDNGFSLSVFNIEEEEVDEVGGGRIQGYGFSPDRKKMFVRKDGSFIVMDAGATSIPDDEGRVDMSGWRVEIDPKAEWRQILHEVWRNQRDFFYDPDMHGVDWEEVWEQYSELLPRIYNRNELNDVLREMLGELCVGHAYIGGGDILGARQIGFGSLGVDLLPHESGAYQITKILKGDKWGDEPESPVGSSMADVEVGEYIVAINNIPLEAGDNIYQRLIDKGGVEILLSVNNEPEIHGSREIPVKAMSSEDGLRYFDWVRDRREYVDKLSNGKIGYIHLPDMMGMGLSMWGRMFASQSRKKALLIDVRYNGGGFVADMILSVLGQKIWAQGKAREGVVFNRPWTGFYGPKAVICNHETGSDGETFSEGFMRLGMGELFGTRTWGGWVGIHGWRPLMDRGFNTVPQSTGWGAFDGKWLIEGPGVYPSMPIVDEPAKMINGEDPQLEATVKHLLGEIEEWQAPADIPAYPRKQIRIKHLR
ncbi:MAG: hypothetical protein HN356_02845 [Calditrichaeota bacterium]|nr:hypothetical protein [Calditrichota bacterium]